MLEPKHIGVLTMSIHNKAIQQNIAHMAVSISVALMAMEGQRDGCRRSRPNQKFSHLRENAIVVAISAKVPLALFVVI